MLFEYVLAFITIYVSVFYLLLYFLNKSRMREQPKRLKKWLGVTIIIPCYNEQGVIGKTLESLSKIDYPRNLLQIMVVDDGSFDKTFKEASDCSKKFGKLGLKIDVFRKPNGGKASALNFGLKKAKFELVATLDSDSYLEKNALKNCVKRFSSQEIGAVTSFVKVNNARNFWEHLQRVEYLFAVFSRTLLSFIDSVNVTPGPLSIYRKNLIARLGGFDETSILEDQEIAFKIQSADKRIVCAPDAIVYTDVPKTFVALLKQRIRWNRGGWRNIINYRHLFSTHYGDFGVFVMPMAALSIIILFAVLAFGVYSIGLNGVGILFFYQYGFNSILYGLSSVHFISAIILFLTISWIILGMREIEGEKVSPFYLVGYLLVFSFLLTVFWAAALWKELTLAKPSW